MASRIAPSRALWQFGFKRTIRGAIVFGLVAAGMIALQALAFAASYPDQAARTAFASSLSGAPALGIIYGEIQNVVSTAGYVVYRMMPVLGLIGAIWALMTTTKLLRGQEEDGRWEVLMAGATTPKRATLLLTSGFGLALVCSYLVVTLVTTLVRQAPNVGLTMTDTMLVTAGIFIPAAIFGALGVLVSQLAITRRRALLYGLVIVFGLFILRALGNTIADIYWLKNLTPFGWSELINPVLAPNLLWLIPGILTAAILFWCGSHLSAKRDLGDSLIRETDTARSHFFLLGSAGGLTLRQTVWQYVWWGLGAFVVTAMIGAVSGIAASALSDSPGLTDVVARLGGSTNDLKLAFLGAGLIFTVIIFLLMATTALGAIRRDEARGYLDNLLVQPVRRSRWLTMRLAQIIVAVLVISGLSGLLTWLLGNAQGIVVDGGTMFLVSIGLVAAPVFLLGIGSLLYGLLPRLAVIGMYVVIAWSFIVDLLKTALAIPDFLERTSLFRYASYSPSQPPDWTNFAWLVGLGLIMMAIGVVLFTKRDIQAE